MRQAREAVASESNKKGQSLGSVDKLHFLTSFLLSPAMSIREQSGKHSWPMKTVTHTLYPSLVRGKNKHCCLEEFDQTTYP